MLDPWTLQRSRWKKQLVARWFENEHLRRATCLRALNKNEAKAFRAYGLRNPIAVVPNGVDLPPDTAPASSSSRTILFLGRIDAKKGIADLLHAWQRVAADPSAAEWRLQVTGWGDPGYVAAMQRLATELEIESSVTFSGPLFNDAKAAAFRDAAAFILPSFSEGLPMAVLEAWSHRLPVLMTRECNLPEGFATGAAREVTLEPGEMSRALLDFMEAPESQRRTVGIAGRRLVERRFTWDRVAAKMHEVYAWVLGGGPPPSSVITD
jgi:poly(glycerol-phosphate) alpha-glucosyltransferase